MAQVYMSTTTMASFDARLGKVEEEIIRADESVLRAKVMGRDRAAEDKHWESHPRFASVCPY